MTDALAVRNNVVGSMMGLAEYISTISEDEFGEALNLIKAVSSALEQSEGVIKQRAVEVVRARGVRETEKGTMSLTLGAYTVRAIPTRTGVDGKKLEAHLRAKGIDPSVAMDATVAWKLNDEKLAKAVASGVLTPKDMEACKHETSYRLEAKVSE